MKNTRTENCIFIILASILIIIPLILYFDLNSNNQFSSVTDISIETVKPNKCILGLYLEFFKVNNSSYIYYPSHFNPISIKNVQNVETFSLLEYIRKEQCVMLNDTIKAIFDSMGTLHKLSN